MSVSDAHRWMKLFMQNAGTRLWDVRAQEGDQTKGEVLIYGPIFSEQVFPWEVAPKEMLAEIEALGDIEELHVYINSPGGDAFAGLAINNILRRQGAEVIVHIDGMAASAASVIAMGGDRIVMPANSLMMIHDAWVLAIGNAAELREAADSLDKLKGALVASYMQHATVSAEEIGNLMSAETWLNADEAMELGLATETEDQAVAAFLRGDKLVVNGQEWDAGVYVNKPPVARRDVDAEELPPITGDQLRRAMAGALGFRLVEDASPEKDIQSELATELELLKLKEVVQ